MTYIHSCSLYCERPECVKAQRDEMRDGIKRHEEMAAMASAEIADLTAELAQLRAVEPVAPPGWREALQFYADRSHFVIADADAWDTVSGEPSNFWCDNGTATVEDGTVAKMALAGTPLSDEDDDGAAPPAQPAEPVQRLSDERAAFEAWHNEYRTQELVRRDDTYYNTHVRCRWEGWQARAIESALQPGWRDIESAPKDGSKILLAKYGWSNDAGDAVQGSDEWKRRILDQTRRKYGLWWCVAGHWSARWNNWNDGVEPSGLASPTHWMPLPSPPHRRGRHDPR